MFRIYQTPVPLPDMSPSPNMPYPADKPLPDLPLRDMSLRDLPFFRNVVRPRSTRHLVPIIILTTPEGVEMSIRHAPPWRRMQRQVPKTSVTVGIKGDASGMMTDDYSVRGRTSKRGCECGGHKCRSSSRSSHCHSQSRDRR
jgi:hypothetical protein